MNEAQANEYIVRINKACDHIDRHLTEEMTLSELARVAGFSEFHFHRIFAAMTGETLFAFILRLRLERAATRLCVHPSQTITQLALECGFTSSAVFCRAFKKRFGCAPSKFRDRNQSQTQSSLDQLLRNSGKEKTGDGGYNGSKNRRFAMKPVVTIEKMDRMRVAYIRYVGPYAGDSKLFEGLFGRLCAWAGPRGVDMSTTYIIYHDDPAITEEQKLRLDVCVPIGEGTEVSGEVCEAIIAGGTYAVGQFVLGTDEYGEAWAYMYSDWLPGSGYRPAEAASFERYSGSCGEDGRMPVDICVPVEVI
jgi:AraC family transcriptional regulator